MMRKKIAVSVLLVLCICYISAFSIAEDTPKHWRGPTDHNRWTRAMIFGNESFTYTMDKKIKLRVTQLEDALLLCIDQYKGSYKDKLDKLCFIDGVPSDLNAIDFTAGNFKEETGHRAYTHRGWNHVYAEFEKEKSHPDIRKQILISVVSYVFGFQNSKDGQQVDKVCDAMCCLLYNTHIIADRYHSESYHGALSTLLLANASSQTESVTHDLLECLPSLFPNERKNRDSDYLELTSGIQRIAQNIVSERRNVKEKDTLLKIDQQYALELKNLLKNHVPKLLQKQPWFVRAFPSNWNSN